MRARDRDSPPGSSGEGSVDDDDKREPGEGRSKAAEETRDRPVRPRAVDRDARREAPNPDRLANVSPARRRRAGSSHFPPNPTRARARECRRDRRRADARRAANAERATRSRDRDRAEAPKTARPAPRPRLPSAPGVRSPPAPRANPAVDSRGEALWLRYFPRDSLFAQPMANPDGTNRPPAGLFPRDRGWPARRTEYFLGVGRSYATRGRGVFVFAVARSVVVPRGSAGPHVASTASTFLVRWHGSPPKTLFSALTRHDCLWRHCCSTTVRLDFASHAGSALNESPFDFPHEPDGVPYDAKAIFVIRWSSGRLVVHRSKDI